VHARAGQKVDGQEKVTLDGKVTDAHHNNTGREKTSPTKNNLIRTWMCG
jgi:hypothetical protein